MGARKFSSLKMNPEVGRVSTSADIVKFWEGGETIREMELMRFARVPGLVKEKQNERTPEANLAIER